MNIVIMNKASQMLNGLEIDVEKSFSGLFSVREIKDLIGFSHYNKIILDISALKNTISDNNLQELATSFDMNKVVLVLENNDESVEPVFISKLISLGIYNFTRNREGILYLVKNSNTYQDVAHLHQIKHPSELGLKKIVKQKIIGVINVTEHAGATTLVYMMVKNLGRFTKCCGIEIGRFDFKHFRRLDLVSTTVDQLDHLINNQYSDYNVLLLDLNDYRDCAICDEIIYLIEPSIIKMNKLIATSNNFMIELKGKNVVLNQSNISEKAVLDFAQETGLYVFHHIKSLNDRESTHADVLDLIDKLKVVDDDINSEEEPKKGLFKFL